MALLKLRAKLIKGKFGDKMKKKLYRAFIELSSNPIQSYFLKTFTASRLSKLLNRSFVKTFNINEKEMEKPLKEYPSLQALFTRKLKAGVRNIDSDLQSVVSPVDGVLSEVGAIKEDCTFFVKGQHYSITDMLGNESNAEKYQNGTFLILYLSPSHYHRIHSPISGQITKQWELGKKSYPVNKWGLLYGKEPLSKNYRLITEIKNGSHFMSVVKVGAFNVNSIHCTYDKSAVNKGEEIGYFSFGSTVILLFEEDMIILPNDLSYPREVKVGEALGRLV